jgi:hypothetical protein
MLDLIPLPLDDSSLSFVLLRMVQKYYNSNHRVNFECGSAQPSLLLFEKWRT